MASTNAEKVLTGQPRGPKKRGVDAVVLPVGPDIAETGDVHRQVPTGVASALRALHRVAYKGGAAGGGEANVRTAGGSPDRVAPSDGPLSAPRASFITLWTATAIFAEWPAIRCGFQT